MTHREYKAKRMHWSVMCESQREDTSIADWHELFNLMWDIRRAWGNCGMYRALRRLLPQ